MERLPLFATASRGTEPFLADELNELGAAKVRQDRGGVRFAANLDELLRIALKSRIAMRMLYPLGDFDAPGAEGLYEAASKVPWEEWLTARSTFAVEATMKDTEHKHTGFVALKLKDAIVDRLRQKLGSRPDVDSHHPDVQVVAHLVKSKLSLSLDVCGEPLFKRGYRVESTPAPLKETLAAAILRAVGYDGNEALVDPMCGSGTLALEAALIALNRAPGLNRSFAIERWPSLGQEARDILTTARAEARAAERPTLLHPITARDRDDDALACVKKNAAAARVQVVIENLDATKSGPPKGPPGLIASNPPYGDRLTAGGQKGMKTFYYQLGEALSWPGWRMALLCGNVAFESAFHHRPRHRVQLWNGPIDCKLYEYGKRGGEGEGDEAPARDDAV